MPTKRELIQEEIDALIRYGIEEKFPEFNQEKVEELKKKYEISYLCGLIKKFCFPAYDIGGREGVKSYLELELIRLLLLSGGNFQLHLRDEQKERITDHIMKIIEVLKE